MQPSHNSNHNSKTDSSHANCCTDETQDIYTLDDLIETLEEVATHLISSDIINCE